MTCWFRSLAGWGLIYLPAFTGVFASAFSCFSGLPVILDSSLGSTVMVAVGILRARIFWRGFRLGDFGVFFKEARRGLFAALAEPDAAIVKPGLAAFVDDGFR